MAEDLGVQERRDPGEISGRAVTARPGRAGKTTLAGGTGGSASVAANRRVRGEREGTADAWVGAVSESAVNAAAGWWAPTGGAPSGRSGESAHGRAAG